MFEQYKTYKVGKSISLDEIIEKYADRYYINIEYMKNGSVNVFIGSNKAEAEAKENRP